MRPEEAAELALDGDAALGRLALEHAERPQLALGCHHILHAAYAQRADQLRLEVLVACVEAEPLHVGPVQGRAQTGPLQRPCDRPLLAGVVERRDAEPGARGPEPLERPAHRLGAADRLDGDAGRGEVEAAALGEREQRVSVALSFDEHDDPYSPSLDLLHIRRFAHRRSCLNAAVATFDDPEFFGEHWAGIYDVGPELDPAPAVEFLAGLASGGRVLELAIGSGRVGLPLAARGVQVEGIEASQAMVDLLAAKPGGDRIPVTVGDMAEVAVEGPFQLVYLIYNTLYNLPSAERQVDCFRNVARVLDADGAFVLECFVLDPAQYDRGQRVEALSVKEDAVVLQVTRHDAAAQRLFKQHLVFDAGGFRGYPVALRYCWPSELDLMARLAGLELAERYAGWDRSPFDGRSESHVSVYRLPTGS